MNPGNELKILITAAEMSPYAKTGGLADVVGSLPKALNAIGNVDVRTVIPMHRAVSDAGHKLQKIPDKIYLNMDGSEHEMSIKYADRVGGWRSYFIDNAEYFDRESLYGYEDDAQRYAFFCRSILEMAKFLDFKPDVIHCNDWQAGLIPTYLKTLYKSDDFFKDISTVFTTHNLAYQGKFPKDVLPELDIEWEEFTPEKLEFWDELNLAKAGLVYSDVISTVSKRYSEEIQTERYGEGLDGVLRYRQDVLFGIANGVDYDVWNPATDQNIAQNYDESNIEKKLINKLALQRENGIPEDPEAPLIGVVSRLSNQKKLEMIVEVMSEIISLGARFVLLGIGDEYYQELFKKLAEDFPATVGVNILFSEPMASRIYSGSDIFLMPSRYEPCGLGQLISMRYGTIPIVRRTGGLADTVQEYDIDTGNGTGFFFEEESSSDMMSALKKALAVYSNRDKWRKLMLNAMKDDFSWKHPARDYIKLYKTAKAIHNGSGKL